MQPALSWRRRWRRDDRGSAAVEMAMLAWVFFAFIGLTVMVGKLNEVSAHVESVARSAARDISLARDTDQGIADAHELIEAQLGDDGMCATLTYDEHITEEGGVEEVRVEIHCEVDLSDASFAILPGDVDFDRSATEVLDEYREREGP